MSDVDLRPLRILASALAGRAIEVAPTEPGDRSWTDGRTIFLEPDVDAPARLRLLAVQASLVAAGSLDMTVIEQLRRQRGVAPRYLAIEGHRALAANEAVLTSWMASIADPAIADAVTDPAGSLDLARRDRGLRPLWEFGTLDPRRITLAADRGDDTELALAPERPATAPTIELDTLDEIDEADVSGLDLGNLLSSPVGGGSGLGRLLSKLLRPSRARDGGGPPGADAPTHVTRGRPGSGRTIVSLTAASALDGIEPDEPATHSYPEWDERRASYRPDWCHVVEDVADPEPGSATALPEPGELRHVLSRLGTGLTPCRRQRQGDDLDLDALVEARVDRLAGGRGSDDVYLENLRRRRDLSVLVLLDVSGSAAEPGVAGRTVHEHQRDAAAALTTVLHRLGDRVGLYAFNSRGRKAVRVTRVKGFDELADGCTSRRLDGLQPGAYTRVGAAIRHGAAVLEREGGTPRRLLVVLSDGFAYDHGYEGRYGEADARRALLEARRQGIGCLCLSVGADVDMAALQRVFGSAAHATIPTAEQLAASIGPLFAAALASAEAQRRRFQRTERTRARLASDKGRR